MTRCRLCHSADLHPLPFAAPPDAGEWRRCGACGSDTAAHTYEQVAHVYHRRDEYSRHIGMQDLPQSRDNFRWVERWFADHGGGLPTRDFLDVGCWNGAALDVFAEAGWSVHGFDVSRPPYFGPHVTVAPFFSEWHFPRRYSAVLAAEVWEHVPDPDRFLHALHAATRPGGLVCVTTPFAPAEFDARVYSPVHLFLTSEPQFRRALDAAMLDVIELRTHPPSLYALCRARA